MAREMHTQFLAEGNLSYKWDPQSMHVFCFCHKLALIVNAGLAALGVKAPPPIKVKAVDRGQFPSIGTITEEDEQEESQESAMPEAEDTEHDPQEIDTDLPDPAEVVLPLDDEGEWNTADAEDEERFPELVAGQEVVATHRREANNVDYILRKVCVILSKQYPFPFSGI
jgi:hypothetical protein